MNTTPTVLSSQRTPIVQQGCVVRPLWDYQSEELCDFMVTPFSKYRDRVWQRETSTPGIHKAMCAVNWGMTLLDGSRLTDVKHAQRLQWAKKLMAILLHAPADGLGPAPGSMSGYQQSFKWLISWMAECGYQQIGEFTPAVFAQYIDDLPRYISEYQDDGEIAESHVRRALNVLGYAWAQRHALARWSITALTHNPFLLNGIDSYAKDIATKARGWIQPLPDEVAVLLFNSAARLLGAPAEDVISLLNAVIETSNKGYGYSKALMVQAETVETFSFSILDGEVRPWHVNLDSVFEEASGVRPQVRLRQLFAAVCEACAITVQGTSGMRISELIGIKAGIDLTTGLPNGVRIEESATGLYEIFIIRTVLSKTEKGLPREVDWVLGLRPKGAAEEPLAVHALRLLNRLTEPWRERAQTTQLFLSLKSNSLPRKTTALKAMYSPSLRKGLKRFMERWVDLSGLPDESVHKTAENDLVIWRESKGTVISSHMLRKSWAQFVFAVNPKLMPAIQLQFHHLSIAMSDSGYISNNPLLVTAMDSVATQQRNLLIYETILGRQPLAGKMGEQIEQATRELAAQVKGLPTSDAWQRTVQFCDDNDLNIFFNPHGKCVPLATSKMRCHNEKGTPLGMRVQPNSSTRQPSLCAGCDCFVLDTRHAPFWEDRYLQNWISYKRAERMGETGQFRVIKDRAVQAGKLLKKIGISSELLDQKVDLALKEDDVTA